MTFVLKDNTTGKYVASTKKVVEEGYLHKFKYEVEYTPLLREAKVYANKEANKWSGRLGISIEEV